MIEPGLANERTWTITVDHLASRYGSGLVDVLATPALVAFCEETARGAVDPLLPEGETSVGTAIELTHTAPTPPGQTVTVTARLTAVDGRRLTFEIEARDGVEPIGRGKHARAIVERERFERRVAEKADAV